MSAGAASNRPYSVTRHVSAADQIAQVDNELLFLSASDARRHRGMGVRLDKDAHRRFQGGNAAHSSDGGENTQLRYTPVVSLKPISSAIVPGAAESWDGKGTRMPQHIHVLHW